MYVQTQGIFDLDTFKRFLEFVDKAGIKTHIMAGIIPLTSAGMAKYMNENVPGIAVPQDMIDRLAAAAEEGKATGVKGLPSKLGIEMAAEMIAKIKDEKLCDGVHIMAIGAEKNVPLVDHRVDCCGGWCSAGAGAAAGAGSALYPGRRCAVCDLPAREQRSQEV
jgi:5,10-methylenetetrahydrofolate reductase